MQVVRAFNTCLTPVFRQMARLPGSARVSAFAKDVFRAMGTAANNVKTELQNKIGPLSQQRRNLLIASIVFAILISAVAIATLGEPVIPLAAAAMVLIPGAAISLTAPRAPVLPPAAP